MSNINCNACNDLRNTSPEFVQNGVTETICASLQKNTGFNPALTTLHDNCEDLNNANDCLIARMDSELESYDVCDWKAFMHKFLPNMYELNKAMICGSCGQWGQIQSFCGLINDILYNNTIPYGTLTGTMFDNVPERKGGEILSKDGSPLVEKVDTDNLWNGVGISYLKRTYLGCDGESRTYEFIQPYMRDYAFKNEAYGDVFWRVPLADLRGWGFTETLINYFSLGPQWRTGYGNAFGLQISCTIRMEIKNGYFELAMIGSTGDINDVLINADIKDPVVIIS